MKVEYRFIADFPGYLVGSDGTVWTMWKKNGRNKAYLGRGAKKLRDCISGRYAQVALTKCGKMYYRKVHILVLEAFVGPRPEGMEGCHFPERDTRNNNLENLRWGTKSENYQDRHAHGTHNDGIRNGRAKLTEADVREIRKRLRLGERQVSLAKEFGVSQVKISQIKLGKSWDHVSDEEETS